MKIDIIRLKIRNFRCFPELTFHPKKVNVLVGPNNIGKTAILEALYLTLSPDTRYRSTLINEYDFFRKQYAPPGSLSTAEDSHEDTEVESEGSTSSEGDSGTEISYDITDPSENDIVIEVVLGPLRNVEQKQLFPTHLEAWDESQKRIVPLDEMPDALDNYPNCVRMAFVAWYDAEEDELDWRTVYVHPDMGDPLRDRTPVNRKTLRELGFLIYRDFRASNNPLTLSTRGLFQRLLTTYEAKPRALEALLNSVDGIGDNLIANDEVFARIVEEFQEQVKRMLAFPQQTSKIGFDVTNLTRSALREVTQAFVRCDDQFKLPLEMFGAGTRSVTTLAILTLIAKKLGHAIMAIEEPETFLYPSAQRAIISEIRRLDTQLFLTTHSPYVLDLFEPDEINVLSLSQDGQYEVKQPPTQSIKDLARYRRLFRSGLSEAILSPRALICEGYSDSVIIRGFSEIARLRSMTSLDFDKEGVAFVEVKGIGQLISVSEFLESLGVSTFILHDKTDNEAENQSLLECLAPTYGIEYTGIERLLAVELSIDTIDKVLAWATKPSSIGIKHPPEPAICTGDEPKKRKAFFELLAKNKTTTPLAQQILDEAAHNSDVPTTLVNLFTTLLEWIQPLSNDSNTSTANNTE